MTDHPPDGLTVAGEPASQNVRRRPAGCPVSFWGSAVCWWPPACASSISRPFTALASPHRSPLPMELRSTPYRARPGRERPTPGRVVESVRFGGLVGVQALAGALAGRSLKPYGDEVLEHMHLGLTSTTDDKTTQGTEVFRIDQGIQRIAEDGNEVAAGEGPAGSVRGCVISRGWRPPPARTAVCRSTDRSASQRPPAGRTPTRSPAPGARAAGC